MAETDPNAARQALGEIDGILQTFRALLRIAQMWRLAAQAELGPVDLGALVGEVADLYATLAEDAGMSLLVRTPLPQAFVRGDRRLLAQLLANLIENAVQHASAGKAVRIGVDDHSAPRVWVEDDGPGIPPEEREAVFRRFYRIDRSRRGRAADWASPCPRRRRVARRPRGDRRRQSRHEGRGYLPVALGPPSRPAVAQSCQLVV